MLYVSQCSKNVKLIGVANICQACLLTEAARDSLIANMQSDYRGVWLADVHNPTEGS